MLGEGKNNETKLLFIRESDNQAQKRGEKKKGKKLKNVFFRLSLELSLHLC